MKMGRYPKVSWPIVKKKKGGWSEEEDLKLAKFINNHGLEGINWETISHKAGLNRCGKSCRLRWKNYLSPHIRRGNFSEQEVSIIIHLHSRLGNKWSQIAAKLPGRTDNDIKNFWNTKLRKKLRQKASTEYSSQPHDTPTTDHNFLANYLISIFSIFLGFFNMPQSEVAQNSLLHLQEWERKQQELMVMASTPNYPFLPDTSTISQPGFGLGNELDSGTSTIPLEIHTNLTSDAWFEGRLLANFFDSNIAGNDLTQYHMLPALVSASDDEFQTPMADEFYVNPNSVASFDHEWVATEMNYQSPDDLGSAMQEKEILASCLGLSPSFMGSASSSNIYDAASSSFYDDFQS